MQPQQMGAFVAHCFGLKKFHSIKCYKTYVEVCFVMENFAMMVDAPKLQQQLETEIAGFADMEPFPCPCGCGAFISVSPCLRQSETLHQGLSDAEISLIQRGDTIGCIKSIRHRLGIGLKDAKDMHDKRKLHFYGIDQPAPF